MKKTIETTFEEKLNIYEIKLLNDLKKLLEKGMFLHSQKVINLLIKIRTVIDIRKSLIEKL